MHSKEHKGAPGSNLLKKEANKANPALHAIPCQPELLPSQGEEKGNDPMPLKKLLQEFGGPVFLPLLEILQFWWESCCVSLLVLSICIPL